MMHKQRFECRIHMLEFEYPDDWMEKGLPPGDCPLCLHKKLSEIESKHKEACEHRDSLLKAIEIKVNAQVNNV